MKTPKKVRLKKMPQPIDPKLEKWMRKLFEKVNNFRLYTEEDGKNLGVINKNIKNKNKK